MKRLRHLLSCLVFVCLMACNQNSIPEVNRIQPTLEPTTEPLPTATANLASPSANLASPSANLASPTANLATESANLASPTANLASPTAKTLTATAPVAITVEASVGADETTPFVSASRPPLTEEPEQPNQQAAMGSQEVALADLDPSNQQIIFWHEYTPELEEILLELVEEFNESNDYNITVALEHIAQDSTLYDKMLTAIVENQLPQLVVTYQHEAAAYQAQESLIDLTGYIEDQTWGLSQKERRDYFASFIASDFHPAFDQQLGFPISRTMDVLYINLDLLRHLGFDRTPGTWDAFGEMACSAKKAGYIGYELTTHASLFTSMIFSRGGNLIAEDHSYYTLYEPEAIETLLFLQTLFAQECASLLKEQDAEWRHFGQGEVLFTIDSSAKLPIYQSAVTQGYDGAWSIAALPHINSNPIVNTYGASLSIPKSTPEAQLAAWLFVKWYTDSRQQARWVEASHHLPVRQSVSKQLNNYLIQNPSYQIAFELLPHSKSEPTIANYHLIDELLTEVMIEIINGADIREALTDLNQEANYMLGKE